MKIFRAFLFCVLFVGVGFGQARKPIKVIPSPSPTPVAAPTPVQPTQKVVVIKTNGDKISGLFVSGDTEKITVRFSESDVSIKLAEVQSITLNEIAHNKYNVELPPPTPPQDPAPTPTTPEPIDFSKSPTLTATLEDANLFPDNYTNHFVRFNGVWIGDIGSAQDGNQTIYLLDVESAKGERSIDDFSTTQVNFILAPETAKSLLEYYNSQGRTTSSRVGVNILAGFVSTYLSGRKVKIAGIRCIEFLNYKGGVSRSLGVCN